MILIYIVSKNKEEAGIIAEGLLTEKLVFSINVLPEILSYRSTEDAIIEYRETLILAKSKALLYKKIEAKVQSMQLEKSPLIFSLPITQINEELFHLIQENTLRV